MKIFVTGADGFIGTSLTSILVARGHDVVGLARDEASDARLRRRGLQARSGDLRNLDVLSQTAKECDGVIHLALELGPEVGARDRAAIDALLSGLGAGKRFVGASAAGLVGDTGSVTVDETRPLPKAGPNEWRVENEARVLGAKSDGVQAMAVRPAPMVFGRGGGQLIPKLIEDARVTGSAHFVGNGAQMWSTAYVDDVAELFADVFERGVAGEAYFAASGEVTAWRDIARAVAAAAGVAGGVASFTVEDAKKAVGFLGELMAIDVRVSNAKARTLGWRPVGPALLDEIARYGGDPTRSDKS